MRALVSPTCLLKLPHEICRRLRGNAGLRARLAARRRGFGRPRNQYQGVQGSQMTLSAVTPGAFGAADAATALRAIGVPENEKSRAEELTRAPDLATVGEHVDTSRPPPEANTEPAAERAEAEADEAKRQLELIDSELRRRGVPAEGPGAEADGEEPVPATREATEWSGACRVYSRSAGQWVEAEIKERSTDGLSFRVEWRPRQKVTQREPRQWKCEKPPGKLASKWISVYSRHLKVPAGKAQWWSQLAQPGARTARPPVGAHLVRNAARKARPKAESVRQAIDGQYFIGVAGGPDDSAAVVQSLQEQQDAAIDLSHDVLAPVLSDSVLAPTSSMTARALADAREYDADGVLAGLAPSGGSGRYDDDLSESDYEEEDAAEEDAAEGESPEKEVLEDTEPDKAEAEAQKAPG